MTPRGLEWAQRLQALAQNGLTFAKDPFDQERYEAIRDIAAEMMATQTETDFEIVKGLFMQETGYKTPKIDSRGAVFRDGRILLVRERADGRWSLPGGWIDVHESPGESVVREIREETGYQTRALKLLAIFDKNKHEHPPTTYHSYKLFFLCEILGGSPTHTIETDGVNFFPEDALPELSVTRVTAGQIARLFEHYRHPDWPTDFD